MARLALDRSFPSYLSKVGIDYDKEISVVSSEQDNLAVVSDNHCSAYPQKLKGAFLHNCDTAAGASGSPILQNGKVVGVHLGYIASSNQNVAQDFSANLYKSEWDKLITNEWKPRIRIPKITPPNPIPLPIPGIPGVPRIPGDGDAQRLDSDCLARLGLSASCVACIIGGVESAGALAALCTSVCGSAGVTLLQTIKSCSR